jgi:hypothetical protein
VLVAGCSPPTDQDVKGIDPPSPKLSIRQRQICFTALMESSTPLAQLNSTAPTSSNPAPKAEKVSVPVESYDRLPDSKMIILGLTATPARTRDLTLGGANRESVAKGVGMPAVHEGGCVASRWWISLIRRTLRICPYCHDFCGNRPQASHDRIISRFCIIAL